MTVHIWDFDKEIKIEGKNFYMPSGKLKIGSMAHAEVITYRWKIIVYNLTNGNLTNDC